MQVVLIYLSKKERKKNHSYNQKRKKEKQEIKCRRKLNNVCV